MSRKVLKSFAAMLLGLVVIAATAFAPARNASAAATPVKGFYVSGTTLYDATGKPFVMRGVNHAHTWYKNDLKAAIPAIAATGSNTVRIVLSNGTQWTRDDIASVEEIIALNDQHNLITMLEVHDATGSDSTSTLNAAVDYWISIKDALIGKEDRVIVNIANEWFGSWSSEGWANGYLSAIPALRQAGIKNTLVVDAAGWGQYPTSIFEKGLSVFNSDPLKNTIFSIHMYEYAGGDANTVKSNIDNVLALNVPVIIGEFGHKHSSGDVDEATILSYTQQKNVGWLAWSWYGNSGGVEYLDLATGPAGSLTEWGQTVVNSTYGTLATSELSGIYTTPGYQPLPDNGGSENPTNPTNPTIPAAPFDLTATVGNGLVQLGWGAATGADSYTVKRSTTSGGPYVTIANGLIATSFTDTGLVNGTTYYYVVSASNSAGTSANSNQVSVTPQGTEQPVPSDSLVVQYRAADTNASDNQIKPHFNIKNDGTTSVNLSDLKLRYYFTKDGAPSMNAWVDWAQIGTSYVQTQFGSVDATNADTYVELSFSTAAGTLAPGDQTGDIQLRIAKFDWSNLDETNDYSFDSTKTSYSDWQKVTLYQNGELVWGIEP